MNGIILEEVKRMVVTEKMNPYLQGTKIFLVKDFDNGFLQKMVDFGLSIFGDLGMSEWGLVPQIKHGNVYILKSDTGSISEIFGIAIFMRDWDNTEKRYLCDYAIAEKWRGKGIGYSFLANICKYLTSQGSEIISLTVDPHNKPAVALYINKLGFRLSEYRKDMYGPGHDRYVLELDLKTKFSKPDCVCKKTGNQFSDMHA